MAQNFDEFVNIKPFNNSDNILNQDTLSDHAQIGFEIDSSRLIGNDNVKYLSSENISNPEYHPYFKWGSTFKDSHLYDAVPYVDDDSTLPMKKKLNPNMELKIQKQLDVFRENICSGSFPVQVIIEGFDEFFKRLENILGSYPDVKYSLIRFKPLEDNHRSNISGILVDTNFFEVLDQGIEPITYSATEDKDKEGIPKVKTTLYPFVKLRNRNTEEVVDVVAVHINGCASQFPVSGLEALRVFMLNLYDKCGQNKIIAIGDYNAPPTYARKVFEDLSFNVLATDYLTHCNPNSRAGKYDMAITYPKFYSPKAMSLQNVAGHSLALVNSINKAIV